MPIHEGQEGNNRYYQFGIHGKRYYFTTEIGRKKAYNRCLKQAHAIKSRGQI